MEEDKPFLGTGWGFPVAFDKRIGVVMVQGEEDIRQSLAILFSTRPGERIFRFLYGCNLSAWVFEKMDRTEITELIRIIEKAILEWEPRIHVESVQIETEDIIEGVLWIHLTYLIRETNSRSNMVYPFYLKEGTNL